MHLKKKIIKTPLGPLIAIGDDTSLYFLEFSDRKGVEESLHKKFGKEIATGNAASIASIEKELAAYFKGTLKKFQTHLHFQGTPFQKRVWENLRKIPYGKTISYKELATALGSPTAYRAAANANGKNCFPIVVPCHRVINANGEMGGYSSGLKRKEWLLNHEK